MDLRREEGGFGRLKITSFECRADAQGISEEFEFRLHKVFERFLALGKWWQREPEMPHERDKNRGCSRLELELEPQG